MNVLDQTEENFFQPLIEMYESCLFQYDLETKEMCEEWKHSDSLKPQKANVQKSEGNVLLSVFWNYQWVILTYYMQKSQTITGVHQWTLLNKLPDALIKRIRGVINKDVHLLPDIAPRGAVEESKFYGFEISPHPPYPTDLVLSKVSYSHKETNPIATDI